ncbi:MAG: response regulator [Bacteroidales bacterium]|jgi:DNA-binding NarL/FixJ family response regulator|nr:response regulator [Bacteroidales bacterium]
MGDKLIFFVDDEPMFINLLEYTFKAKNGYVTKTFSNGEDCIEHLYMNPSLVVVDFFLGGNNAEMTGLDLVRKIKKDSPFVSVIVLSGNDDEKTIEEAKASGVEEYIIKDGYFIDNLIESISKILPPETN